MSIASAHILKTSKQNLEMMLCNNVVSSRLAPSLLLNSNATYH